MKSKPKKSGFTLIEVLVVVGILTLIIGASFTLLSSGRLSANLSEARIQTSENARIAMNRITRELRLSRGNRVWISNNLNFPPNDISPNPGTVITFQIPVGSYAPQLQLNPDNSLQWGCAGNQGHFLAYSVVNSQLLRRAYYADGSLDVSEIIANHISSVTFSRTSAGSQIINIAIVSQRQTAQGPITQTLSSLVRVRN